MTDETVPAATPAEATTQPAEQTPAQETYHEQPAATPEHENYDEPEPEEPADLGEILEDRPKKLSGAQRAKLHRQHLENELRGRDERIAALERYINKENDRRRGDAQRSLDDAHMGRLKDAREAITDFDRVMSKMRGVEIREDLIEEIKASDKSALLAYHLANNADKVRELNAMSARDRAREIGRLEGSLKMPEGRKQTAAPRPPSTLRGGAAPHTALEHVDDMNEFADRLLKDLAKRSGR